MGGVASSGEDNDELVDNLVEAEYVKTESVERAMRLVDRGDYYLEAQRDQAYKDTAWKSGNLHISAPCIYSEVLESLELGSGMSFLNLGSGTGYLSTIVGVLIGSRGINHGVELHADVVSYARERLQEFVRNSSALDVSEFVAPLYLVGNCLQLEPGAMGTYDRIYCGAGVATPEQASFIKRLVKIGGIVVMPFGDQLKRYKRTGLDIENGFEEKNVLPVSFATLVSPTAEQLATANAIYLPERSCAQLQELCRSKIRCVVRTQVETEMGEPLRSLVKERSNRGEESSSNQEPQSNSQANRRRRRMRRVLIPVFRHDSDDDDQRDDDRADDQNRRLRRQIIAIGAAGLARGAEGRIEMQTLRWNRYTMQRNDNANHNNTQQQENSSSDSEHENVAENRGEEPAIDLSDPDMEGMVAREESPPAEEPICRAIDVNKQNEEQNGQNKRTHSETSVSSAPTQARKRRPRTQSSESSTNERHSSSSSDSDDEKKEERRLGRERDKERLGELSRRIKDKIGRLPLPEKLLSYVNFGRE